jgi:D-threonine aldolase
VTKAWYEVNNIEEIPSPSLLVYPDRIQENLRRMIAWVGDPSKLRPHVKTHKMPQIVRMKLASGITKFKASTIAEVEMTAAAGGEDILLAYQPVGPNVARLIELIKTFPEVRISAIVDNVASVDAIALHARANQVTVPLYMDLNVGMNRTGIVPGDQAKAVYRHMCRTTGIEPAGFHAYDGHLHESDWELLKAQAKATFDPVWSMRDELIREGFSVPCIVAGGTPTSKLLAEHQGVEVGAGTTVLWDLGQPSISPDLDFQNAILIVGRVISQPTSNRLCLDVGHKAIASEMVQPRVRWMGLEDASIVGHNEEHMVLETSRCNDYPVGTVLYGIPRHVCPTVALHSEVWIVQNGQAREHWPVVARTRCITI